MTWKRVSTKWKLFREKIVGVRFLRGSFGTCLEVLCEHMNV